FLVNCAGLYSDEVARLMGIQPEVRIIPFRGEYYMLRPDRRSLVRNLIYPVPDPEFPFLGVHFTRTVHGDVEAGPNAVLAFAREDDFKISVTEGAVHVVNAPSPAATASLAIGRHIAGLARDTFGEAL